MYRVAVRVLVVQDNKVLLVKEKEDEWWALPGGGIEDGETANLTLTREIEEELGIPSAEISSDYKIAYYNIGAVVNGVPRMNIYFKASVPKQSLQKTDHVAQWLWFTKDEFMNSGLNPLSNKTELASVIFGE